MKIFFLIYPGWPGVATVLRTIRDTLVEKNPEYEIETLEYSGSLNFSILKKIKNEAPSFLLLGGWDTNIKLLIQNVVRPKTKVILEWCSPLTQMDLSGEISRFMEAMEFADQGLIDYFSILLESDYQLLSKIRKYFIYMPVFINGNELDTYKQNIADHSPLACDLFCAPCPRKNIFTQLVALSILKGKVKPYVNYTPNSVSCEYLEVLAKLFGEGNYENNLWMQRTGYLKKIQQMDFAMQVTLSESFNFTAAEHMYYGIPVLFSKSSPISKNMPSELRELVVENYDDVTEIYSRVNKLASDKNFRMEMGQLSADFIRKYSNENKEILFENLNKVLG